MSVERDKTMYLASYLKNGSLKTWYYALKVNSPHLLDNFTAFVADFRIAFADPNVAGTALCKIKELKQNGSCSLYSARFRELLAYLHWDDQSKLAQFKEGLKSNIRNKLIGAFATPPTFDAYIK